MTKQDKYIKLYASCIPVKGYSRSIICDTHFLEYQLIPNDLYALLTKRPSLKLNEIYALHDKNDHAVISEYITVLENKDFIFFTDNPDLYPDLEITYETPSLISNAVLDINININISIVIQTIKGLNQLNCEAILLRIIDSVTPDGLMDILQLFDNSTIMAIELHIAEFVGECVDFEAIIKKNDRVKCISVFNTIEPKQWEYADVPVTFIKKAVHEFGCGEICPSYFSFAIDTIMEAHCYNSCLNKKIYIDKTGTIKNCPFTKKSFGKITEFDIQDIINTSSFQLLWSITKDKIDVCKDCEFRYVCSDCRVFIKDPDNIYSQPAKCTYNPYIAKWQGEDGYVPVEECGAYSKTTGFVPNHDIVAQLNKTIWSENT
jgi:SPASM domain peptide maturase of grasp-with-spasm system